MAGASMNDIKARMKSVRGTMQITKAMELVATSKLRHAKERVEQARPFCHVLDEAIARIGASGEVQSSPYAGLRADPVTLYVVIAGDRGLAGGFNANLFRMTEALDSDGKALYLPIGKKATEHYLHRGKALYTPTALTVPGYAATVGVGDAMNLGAAITEGFLSGAFDRVVLVYTKFVSMLTQAPVHEQILPLTAHTESGADASLPYEPLTEEDPAELLARIVPDYVGGILYAAVTESLAAESAARRSAMSAANKNASEMIDTLTLRFNRARQAVITQEITEIVSGAEAL